MDDCYMLVTTLAIVFRVVVERLVVFVRRPWNDARCGLADTSSARMFIYIVSESVEVLYRFVSPGLQDRSLPSLTSSAHLTRGTLAAYPSYAALAVV